DRETGNIADQRDIALEGGTCERALLHHPRSVSGDEFEAAVNIAAEVDVFDITFDGGEDERAVSEILFRHGDGIERDIAPVRIGLRHGFGDLAQRLDVDCLADEFSRGGSQRGGGRLEPFMRTLRSTNGSNFASARSAGSGATGVSLGAGFARARSGRD